MACSRFLPNHPQAFRPTCPKLFPNSPTHRRTHTLSPFSGVDEEPRSRRLTLQNHRVRVLQLDEEGDHLRKSGMHYHETSEHWLRFVLTYNILTGGTGRRDQLATMIGATGADVVGLVEATNPVVIEELSQGLGMDFRLSGQATHERDWQVGVMSRLPIVNVQVHSRPDVFTRKYLL